jgi:hypothetical protein
LYTKYIPTGTKENIIYQFYKRSTIPWKLACESNAATSRLNVFATYGSVVDWNPSTLLVVYLTSTILFSMTAFCLIASSCTGARALTYKNSRRFFIIQVSVMGILQIASIIACLAFVQAQKSDNLVQAKKV